MLLSGCAEQASEPAAAGPGGDGSGGGGGADAGACPDLSATGSCRREGPGQSCAVDEVCTIAAGRSCGAARCCTLPFECVPFGGGVPGGFACEDDGACESGACMAVGGRGVCLRACVEGDGIGSGCPLGFTCAVFSLDATRSVLSCVGVGADGAFDGARVLCHRDRDCPEGRYCYVEAGAAFYDGAAFGRCEPDTRTQRGLTVACEAAGPLSLDESPTGPQLPDRVTHWSAGCAETGLCHAACIELDPDGCNCRQPQDHGFCRGARCTPPCRNDDDCPSPMVCQAPRAQELRSTDPDLQLRLCVLPVFEETEWGCFDETDCCRGGLQRIGTECCNHSRDGLCSGPVPERTHCRVTPEVGRYTSRCELPTGRGEPGAGCTTHADCESALCAPTGVCTSPCDPGPGDRCAEILPGTQCCPTPIEAACIPSCRADCAGGPTCTP